MKRIDAAALTQALIRCPSVTPNDAGALELLDSVLVSLGFTCRMVRLQAPGTAAVDNLYARLGRNAPNFCFAGHTDVVPPGQVSDWTVDPFGGEIIADRLFGRGATDMKGAIAAFIAAVSRLLTSVGKPAGSISLLITGDEEGVATNGTRAMLPLLAKWGEHLDACLVGEPTCAHQLGDVIKIGRRGSLNGQLTVPGNQGHVAYPERADNPLPRLVRMLDALLSLPLDQGTTHFPPSSLVLTSIDVGNPATNVIPAVGTAAFNIRFNPLYTATGLEIWLRQRLDAVGGAYLLDLQLSGDAFLTLPGPLCELVSRVIERETGLTPDLNTGGGTSDARFIKDLCPVVEFGLPGGTMHKVDEHLVLTDLDKLVDIYTGILTGYFNQVGA